jgi:ABC-2 type transport system permease protein
VNPSPPAVSSPRPGGVPLSALWTLFTLTLRQFLRGRRMFVLTLLALLPAGLAVLLRTVGGAGPPRGMIEFVCLFTLLPHTLLPLTALLYATGMILDEQEEQTLTYLLTRPLPRWALYLTKLLAAWCMVAALCLAFVLMTYAATYLGSAESFTAFPAKVLGAFGVMLLAVTAYVAVFGCLSLLVRWSMIAGIIYIAAIEYVLANVPLAVRKLTIMYYFRVLALDWLDLDARMTQAWGMNPDEAPSAAACVLTLLTVSAAATALAALMFSRREFHVKTPEGN